MAVDAAKRAALIEEGMTEGEADYMLSGGLKDEGLTPPPPAEEEATEPAQGATDAGPAGQARPAQPAQVEEDDLEPARDNPYYPQWRREKAKRHQLTEELRKRDEAIAAERAVAQQEREKWARLEERMRVFREAAEQPAEQPQARVKPDRESDPFGYMAWLEEQLDTLRPQVEQVRTSVQERDAAQELQTSYMSDARAFASATPDFGQAYNWLMQNRDAELQAAGYVDLAERRRIIALDERDIVARALQARQTNPQAPGPAQVVYGLARARGFQPQVAPAQPAQQGNGLAAPARAPGSMVSPRANGAAGSVADQVGAIQRGQAASRSLSSAGGSPAPQGIDLARIADMSDGEYLEWKMSLTPGQRREFASMLGVPGR